ncbi:MAG: phosphate ABC transporter permease subunit PstC [Bacillota bacterium]|nr:phosphate ABC transporter permease subunit PstC [Bacillota bacterium]MDW7683910.1 phosphate ABC transporter permease subunit PstC [Bacillota bacterium]
MNNKRETAIAGFFFLNGALVIFILAGIFYLLLANSFTAWQEVGFLRFLTGLTWNPTGYHESSYGILTLIVGTLMVTAGAMVIAVPLGIACAAYLAEVASPWEREVIKPVVEVLAAVPSVVLGFFGIVVLSPLLARFFGLNNGLNALNGAILLALMSLPTMISIAEDALTAVPREFKEASLALGATRWQTLLHVLLPAAGSGVTAAVMLGVGRAVGETMTVIMATGNALKFPSGFFDSVRTMTATIAIELGEVPYNTTHYFSLFAIGFVLFAMTFLVSLLADIFLHRSSEVSKR